ETEGWRDGLLANPCREFASKMVCLPNDWVRMPVSRIGLTRFGQAAFPACRQQSDCRPKAINGKLGVARRQAVFGRTYRDGGHSTAHLPTGTLRNSAPVERRDILAC